MGVMESFLCGANEKIEERTVHSIPVFSRSVSLLMLGEIRSWTLGANLYEEAWSMARETRDHGVGTECDGFVWAVGKRATRER